MNLNSRRNYMRTMIAACIALACAGPAAAEKADRDKPIYANGDTGGANMGDKTGELAGNVVITQGTLTIHASRVQFKQNADNSVSATAYGSPVTFREKQDDSDEYYEGYAQRIVYDGTKRFVELFDNALLKKSGDEIRGNYISYNAATNVMKAEGRPDAKPPANGETSVGPRVRAVFQPQQKGDKDAKDGSAAPPKANPSLPLKSDSTLNTTPAK